ncbi:hypothetical protein B9Z55_003466 [Caenorhabditis nigoni]|uniref:SET domain-containing protein n=1 Tax=Caenorhabditis nigoni TaxID=1611254 RepID=A0A2G5VQH5_9PELO|nr:hypothetical protein B9Z55_003466 [Caenorhabditis nigoni]
MSDSSKSVQKSFEKSVKFGEKEPTEEVFTDDEPAKKRSKNSANSKNKRRAAEEKLRAEEQRAKEEEEELKKLKEVMKESAEAAQAFNRPVTQFNEYSNLASELLNSLPQTVGADILLKDVHPQDKAEALADKLLTTEDVEPRELILEITGRVSMAAEVQRSPGGGNGIFMYDGLMRGTAGEDIMGGKQEFICIETTNVARRSCTPNCVLKHVLGSQATLGIFILATKSIARGQEVTLPFDADWIQSDVPLKCVDHSTPQTCPWEEERMRVAATKARRQPRFT